MIKYIRVEVDSMLLIDVRNQQRPLQDIFLYGPLISVADLKYNAIQRLHSTPEKDERNRTLVDKLLEAANVIHEIGRRPVANWLIASR